MNFLRAIQIYYKDNPIFYLFEQFFFNRIKKSNIPQEINRKKEQFESYTAIGMNPNIILQTVNPSSQAVLHSTIQKFSTQARKPMIKFLGPRLPRPKYNRSSTAAPPPSSSTSKSSRQKAASSGVAIEFYELPKYLRPKPISEEEIQFINNGGCLN